MFKKMQWKQLHFILFKAEEIYSNNEKETLKTYILRLPIIYISPRVCVHLGTGGQQPRLAAAASKIPMIHKRPVTNRSRQGPGFCMKYTSVHTKTETAGSFLYAQSVEYSNLKSTDYFISTARKYCPPNARVAL